MSATANFEANIDTDGSSERRLLSAVRVIRDLERKLEPEADRRSRSIFRDVLLALHDHPRTTRGLTVQQIAYLLEISVPTARQACRRMAQTGLVRMAARVGKSEIYALNPEGAAFIAIFARTLDDVLG